ncbi:hypothetical protein ABZV81_21745 [Streptomyces parvus]|uniref:hypothetical protein n=1 Tax=Streptomyces parvus TaxID=66428 RepID=UPI0033ADC9A2
MLIRQIEGSSGGLTRYSCGLTPLTRLNAALKAKGVLGREPKDSSGFARAAARDGARHG